jgi:hypothetical protein
LPEPFATFFRCLGQGGPGNDKLEAGNDIQAISQQAASRDKICCHLL